jgi:very-short-patch-repair endonuclease
MSSRGDGSHHFEDKDAYRRDRRKDELLQENGYFILRFLADDVMNNLGELWLVFFGD